MESKDATARQVYWRENRRWMLILGTIWFIVSLGCGVLWVEPLNQIQVGGYKLGFWFAQQGSILVYIVLIFFYSWRMNAIDRKYGVDDVTERDQT